MQHWFEHLDSAAALLLQTETGQPVMVGMGAIQYLGGWPDEVLWDRIVADACARQGVPVQPMIEGLRLRDTRTHRFAFNYGPEPVDYRGQSLGPAGVAWWPLEQPRDQ